MRKILLAAVALVCVTAICSASGNETRGPEPTGWHPDILEGFEARTVNQGESYDGPVVSTIVRRKAKGHSRRAYVYVHGFNDYFFQSEMGRRFVDSGYNFYAVDLRRYGRSLRPWQYPFDIRDMQKYFADIDSTLAQARRDGNTDITLSGHSTGGLTVALFAAVRGARCGVQRIVTDSPFLQWNFPAAYRHLLIPCAGFLHNFSPNMKIRQGRCDGYAYSLLRQYHGEWTYNTDWKMIYSPPVTTSWMNAISRGQSRLMKNAHCITVPVLVMHSSRKIDGCNWTPEFQTGDAVLNPMQIAERGARLGSRATVVSIDSALHDIILSRPEVRDRAYRTIFSFIRMN